VSGIDQIAGARVEPLTSKGLPLLVQGRRTGGRPQLGAEKRS